MSGTPITQSISEILWSIYEHDLDAIEGVVDILIGRARGAKPPQP